MTEASIAQLVERVKGYHEVPGSIPGAGFPNLVRACECSPRYVRIVDRLVPYRTKIWDPGFDSREKSQRGTGSRLGKTIRQETDRIPRCVRPQSREDSDVRTVSYHPPAMIARQLKLLEGGLKCPPGRWRQHLGIVWPD